MRQCVLVLEGGVAEGKALHSPLGTLERVYRGERLFADQTVRVHGFIDGTACWARERYHDLTCLLAPKRAFEAEPLLQSLHNVTLAMTDVLTKACLSTMYGMPGFISAFRGFASGIF